MKKNWKKLLVGVLAGTMTMANMVFPVLADPEEGEETTVAEDTQDTDGADDTDEEGGAEVVDLDGTYNAYIQVQTPKWSYRNAFNEAEWGLEGSKNEENNTNFNVLHGWDSANNLITVPGDITDAVLEGNGTYTVKIENVEWAADEFSNQETYNVIAVGTDIPYTEDITLDDVTLKIGGRTVDITPIVDPDLKKTGYLGLLIQNIWNEEVKEIGYYDPNSSSVEITFTVSGFNYDNEAQEEDTPEETTAAEDTTPAGEDENTKDTTAASAETTANSGTTAAPSTSASNSSSNNTGWIIAVVVVVVVIIVVVIVAVKKKKN